MTKNEYLILLAAKLQPLIDDADGRYPGLRSVIAYYSAKIDDIMASGVSEEEAVSAMEAPEAVAARIAAEYGPQADAVSIDGALFREFDPESIMEVHIRDDGHAVRIEAGEGLCLSCKNDKYGEYSISSVEGVLTLTYCRNKKAVLRSIFGWYTGAEPVVLTLPQSWHGRIDVRTHNAGVSAEGVSPSAIRLRSDNAQVRAKDVEADTVELATSNARAYAGGVRCRTADIAASNAQAGAEDVKAETVNVSTSNGGIRLEAVVCDKLLAETSNASVKVNAVDAQDAALISSNGSISGTLAGACEDYAVDAATSNGGCSLVNSAGGSRRLTVHTSNARIALNFEK